MKRSDQQRKAIEIFCRELAEALGNAGVSMNDVFKIKTVDIPWTDKRVIDLIWMPVHLALFGKRPIKKLEPDEVKQICSILNSRLFIQWNLFTPVTDKAGEYFQFVADLLNSAGIGLIGVFEKMKKSLPWNQERVKDLIWKNIQLKVLGKPSTTQLERSEVDAVYEVVNKVIADNFGIHVPFPSEDR